MANSVILTTLLTPIYRGLTKLVKILKAYRGAVTSTSPVTPLPLGVGNVCANFFDLWGSRAFLVHSFLSFFHVFPCFYSDSEHHRCLCGSFITAVFYTVETLVVNHELSTWRRVVKRAFRSKPQKSHARFVSLWKFDTRVEVQKCGVARKPNPRRRDREAEILPLHFTNHALHSASLTMSGEIVPLDCYPLFTIDDFQCISKIPHKRNMVSYYWTEFPLVVSLLSFRRTVATVPL